MGWPNCAGNCASSAYEDPIYTYAQAGKKYLAVLCMCV